MVQSDNATEPEPHGRAVPRGLQRLLGQREPLRRRQLARAPFQYCSPERTVLSILPRGDRTGGDSGGIDSGRPLGECSRGGTGRAAATSLVFGRIVVSEIEVPNMLEIPV